MRDLKQEYTIKGFKLSQIRRAKNGYIYEKQSNEGSVTYEVFKYVENRKYKCVSYPTEKAFGSWAWAYWNLETALRKLESINK